MLELEDADAGCLPRPDAVDCVFAGVPPVSAVQPTMPPFMTATALRRRQGVHSLFRMVHDGTGLERLSDDDGMNEKREKTEIDIASSRTDYLTRTRSRSVRKAHDTQNASRPRGRSSHSSSCTAAW